MPLTTPLNVEASERLKTTDEKLRMKPECAPIVPPLPIWSVVPALTFVELPDGFEQKLLYENARQVYGLPLDPLP